MNKLEPRESEPPSSGSRSTKSLFLIGKDRRGNWVVRDQQGLYGGLFINRAEALKFALFENGNRPQAVIMVPGVFEFNLNAVGAIKSPPEVEVRIYQHAA